MYKGTEERWEERERPLVICIQRATDRQPASVLHFPLSCRVSSSALGLQKQGLDDIPQQKYIAVLTKHVKNNENRYRLLALLIVLRAQFLRFPSV